MPTAILRCTCNHIYQDKTYGNKLRVHNQSKGKDGKPKWRCTICCTQKDKGEN